MKSLEEELANARASNTAKAADAGELARLQEELKRRDEKIAALESAASEHAQVTRSLWCGAVSVTLAMALAQELEKHEEMYDKLFDSLSASKKRERDCGEKVENLTDELAHLQEKYAALRAEHEEVVEGLRAQLITVSADVSGIDETMLSAHTSTVRVAVTAVKYLYVYSPLVVRLMVPT